jgi:hypothetical protein
MAQGSLGECFFRLGQLDRASEATRSALGGCLRSGDIEGIIVYTGIWPKSMGGEGITQSRLLVDPDHQCHDSGMTNGAFR